MYDTAINQPDVRSLVRRRNNTRDTGLIIEIINTAQRPRARVQFATGTKTIPLDQLELVPSTTETASDLLRSESICNVRELRRHLAHVRLSGRMSDMLYSLESTDTDFYAHQFKPVLKMLDSPTGHLLIADEVGLGKTIEAGLIWTELSARMRFRRLLVVCPKVLCEKWRSELITKFDLDARIMSPSDIKDALTSTTAQHRGFVGICGMQSIRPRRSECRNNRPADLLADAIDELDPFDDRLDLVVIDEAHHMRNPGTQTHELGKLLAKISNHVVMLTATPINLRNRDLHSLLRLLDEDTFLEQETLELIVDANSPIIEARKAVLSGKPINEIWTHLEDASRHELLSATRTLASIRSEIAERTELDPTFRADLAHRLDGLNQLANVINRTRRRDVQEHRVIREVKGQVLEMTEAECSVYARITSVVRDFAAQSGLSVGFLTVMPQRMLASSIPASLAHWRTRFDISSSYEDDLPDGLSEAEEERLVDRLAEASFSLPAPTELEAQDTKFVSLKELVSKLPKDMRNHKIIVFSTFRPTLRYLERRFGEAGFGAIRLDGDVKDRAAVLDQFRDDAETRILLSSEIGSEGIDLDFAQIVVNYDLPWNPMKVEQRIGRVDRLGQKSDKVFIFNLVHQGTIEAAIWQRLYCRLRLCEYALGGFEAILAEELERELTSVTMDPSLTEAQRQERLEQSARAFENNRRNEDELEARAAALIVHGDYVVREIERKRKDGRWITQSDLAAYIASALEQLYPGSRVTYDVDKALLDIRLDGAARSAYRDWCETRRSDGGELAASTNTVTFRLEKERSRKQLKRLSTNHSIVRFLSDCIDNAGGVSESAVAVRIDRKELNLSPGLFVGVVQEWRFGSDQVDARLVWRLINAETWENLPPEQAELVLRRAIDRGAPLTGLREHLDLHEVADGVQQLVDQDLTKAFDQAVERRESEMEDRLAIQMAALDRAEKRDVERIERTIELAGPNMEAANRGRLRALKERIADRRHQLQKRVSHEGEAFTIAAVVIKVEGLSA